MTTKTAIRTGIVAACVYAATMPFVQAQEDALRTQIMNDLRADPRSAEMSEAELNALVETLAQQAAEDGVTGDLAPQSSFDFSSQFPPPQAPVAPFPTALAIALLSLLSALGLIVIYILRHRAKRLDLQKN